MSARPRTTFDKLQKERARQEKQAAKRARRQGTSMEGETYGPRIASETFGEPIAPEVEADPAEAAAPDAL